MSIRYKEDFQVGDTFELGSLTVTQEDIIAFARQFDPQPFHIDPELAKDSIFEGLVASGWHTTAMFMRLLVDGLLNKTISIASPVVQDVRWLKHLRPDLYAQTMYFEQHLQSSNVSHQKADPISASSFQAVKLSTRKMSL